MFLQLTMIETVDEKAQGTFKRIRATRETTGGPCQTSQIVAQLSISSFDRVGIRLAMRNLISTQVIPETIISIKGITVIALGLGCFIHHVLEGLLSAFPDYFPAQEAACLSIYDGGDVDPVFLSPIKVNNSSISAALTCSGIGVSGS